MKILSIETSCDETAVAIVEAEGDIESPRFHILGNALFSQVKIHEQYGGVFPQIAKREHAKNLVPLMMKAFEDAGMLDLTPAPLLAEEGEIQKILEREQGLFEALKNFLEKYKKPEIDYISVTKGPGLEPALWVGVSFAKALGLAWNIPVIAANHMEGHIVSPLLEENTQVEFPALALLISGGHTELVLIKKWGDYKIIGKTRDDAVGEAFDKVARLLNLPYPGGPEISKLAHDARVAHTTPRYTLPRPMIHSKDYDFSFSGIKTSVLYTLQKEQEITDDIKKEMSLEFENAATEVLIEKTRKALDQYEIKTLILGGGVIANTYIRESFKKLVEQYPETRLLIPAINLATDNAIMIAAAGYINILNGQKPETDFKAEGNLSL